MDDRAARDARLIREVLDGRPDAFAEIVLSHQRLVASLAWRHGVRREEIEDVVSEVFMKAYRRLGSFRPDHPFATWLWRIAVNHLLDRARRVRRSGTSVELSDRLGDPAPGPHEESVAAERARIVRQGLTGLKARYREVLELVYVEGASVEEAARVLGVPQGTIKSRLLRGRDALRRLLERRHPEFCGS